jgi:phage shock protein E
VRNGLLLVVLALSALFVAWRVWRTFGNKVAPSVARELVSGGALLLDVRTTGEFAGGHLPGAKNIPVQELERRLGEVGNKERPVVLYCQSGMRSATAAAVLQEAGYRDVHDLGAMGRWGQ